jgi:hypothetical protein
MYQLNEIGRPNVVLAVEIVVVNEFISAGSHQPKRGKVDASSGKQGLGAADLSREYLGVP